MSSNDRATPRRVHDFGSEGWYMPVVAEAVPGVLHVFILCRTLRLRTPHRHDCWNQYGYSTWDRRFALCLYNDRTVIYPQSPYQNSFSGLIWFVAQKPRRERYKDQGLDGELKSVSSNMAQGQMPLTMEETEGRKGRDKRAILVDNLREDAEMYLFVTAIPGSFSVELFERQPPNTTFSTACCYDSYDVYRTFVMEVGLDSSLSSSSLRSDNFCNSVSQEFHMRCFLARSGPSHPATESSNTSTRSRFLGAVEQYAQRATGFAHDRAMQELIQPRLGKVMAVISQSITTICLGPRYCF
jgi:hypothetical protein